VVTITALSLFGARAIVRAMWRSSMLAVIAFASGCHVVYPLEPWDGEVPNVVSSPSPASPQYGAYPQSLSITLAADIPGTMIYYTTDGSTPRVGSETTLSAPTPIRGITLSTTTKVRYFGLDDGARSMERTEEFAVDPMVGKGAGYLVTNTTLDGESPVVIAEPGATLSGRATVQAWVQQACRTCKAQVVYGIDGEDQGCIYDGNPSEFPGATTMGKTFDVHVPMAAGVYEVMLAHIEELSCADAMQVGALKNRENLERIGVIVVP